MRAYRPAMRRATGYLTAGLLLLGLAGAPVPAANAANAVAGGPEHRVFVAYLSNAGSFVTTPQVMADGVDAALARWHAMAPATFGSSIRVGPPVPYAAPDPTARGCGVLSDERIDRAQFTAVEQAVGMGQAPAGVVEHLVIFVPFGCLSQGGGFNELGGTQGRSPTSGGDVAVVDRINGGDSVAGLTPLLVEYLGRNFGLGQGDVGCAPGTPCNRSYHSDCYSPLGMGPGLDLGTAARAGVGILEPGEVAALDWSAGPVDLVVSLRPRGESSGVRGLSVADPETGQTYYVDYRAFVGLDDHGSFVPGCTEGLVVNELTTQRATLLRPPVPFQPLGLSRTSWKVGESIQLSGAVRLDVVSLDPVDGAQVRVRITPGPQFDAVGSVKFDGAVAQDSSVGVKVKGFAPAPERYSYRWYADGVLLADPYYGDPVGTAWAHVPDDAHTLSVEVTAYHSGRSYVVARARSGVSKNLVRGSKRPVLRGKLAVGHRVKAVFHKKPQGPGKLKIRTRWYADGRLVATTKTRSLRLPPGVAGKRLRVVVIISGKEVVKAVRKSRSSRPVKQ